MSPLIPIGVLLFAPGQALFLLKNSAGNAATHGAQLASANKGIHTAFAIAFAIVVRRLVWSAGKLTMGGWRKRRAVQ